MVAPKRSSASPRGRGRRYRPPHTISRTDYLDRGRDEWFREAIYAIVRALRVLLVCRDAFARELGLTASQFAVLMGVAYRQEALGVNIRDLAQHVAMARTHVTTDVGRLIGTGYLEKRPNPQDGRGVLVSLSDKGRSAVERIAPLVRSVNDVLFDGIDARSVKLTARLMGRVTANAERVIGNSRRRPRGGVR